MHDSDVDTEKYNETKLSITLSGVLEVAGIESLFRLLEQALCSTKSTLLLNAEEVERVDCAALQLLAVFYREAQEQGYAVRWNEPSSALLRSAQIIGIDEFLGLKNQSNTLT